MSRYSITFPGDAAVFSVLLERAGQTNSAQTIFTLASVLNATKTPWMGSPDKQEEWKKKFYDTYKATPDSARKSVLNGALMNADKLSPGYGMMATAKLGFDDFKDAREGLKSTLLYPESPDCDNADSCCQSLSFAISSLCDRVR